MQDTVGVDVKRHFNLWHAAGCWWNAFKVELAQHFVGNCNLTFALEHLDRHSGLVVIRGRESLGKLGGDGGVLGDHLGHDTAQGFNTQGQRCHVQQQHVLAVAAQYLALNRSTYSHCLVGVDVFAWLFAKQFLDLFLDFGHAGHAADQDHVVNIGSTYASVFQGCANRGDSALDQLFNQAFQLGAGEFDIQVLGTRRIGSHVGKVNVGLCATRELDLGFLSSFLQALQSQNVLAQVNALFLLELGNDEVDDALVKVFTTQEGVAVGREHFKLLFSVDISDFDDGNVKGAATQVVDRNLAVAFFIFVQTKSQCSCGGLVDDTFDIQACYTASVLGGLALCVIEIRGNRDHCLGNGFAQVVLSSFLHFAKHIGADLLGSQSVAAHFYPCVTVVGSRNLVRHQIDVLLHFFFGELAANQALDGIQGIAWIGHRLAFGRCANQYLAVLLVSNDGRGGTRTFCVFNNLGGVAFHDGHAAVGGSQIDSNNSSHGLLLVFSKT